MPILNNQLCLYCLPRLPARACQLFSCRLPAPAVPPTPFATFLPAPPPRRAAAVALHKMSFLCSHTPSSSLSAAAASGAAACGGSAAGGTMTSSSSSPSSISLSPSTLLPAPEGLAVGGRGGTGKKRKKNECRTPPESVEPSPIKAGKESKRKLMTKTKVKGSRLEKVMSGAPPSTSNPSSGDSVNPEREREGEGSVIGPAASSKKVKKNKGGSTKATKKQGGGRANETSTTLIDSIVAAAAGKCITKGVGRESTATVRKGKGSEIDSSVGGAVTVNSSGDEGPSSKRRKSDEEALKGLDRRVFRYLEAGECREEWCRVREEAHCHRGPACDCTR